MVMPGGKGSGKGPAHAESKATTVPKASGIVVSDVFNRQKPGDQEQVLINLHGQPTSGKTWAALSASAYWPSDAGTRAKESKPVLLRDVLYIGHDANGIVGAHARKIRAAYEVSVPELLSKGRKSGKSRASDITDVMDIVTTEVQNIIAQDTNVKLAIDDTISRMDKYLVAFWSHKDNMPIAERSGEEDSRSMYRRIFFHHHQYQSARIMLPMDVVSIFLFHGRIIEDDPHAKKEKKKRQEMLKINNEVFVLPQITGQAIDVYTSDASAEFACVPIWNPAKKITERWLYTIPAQGARTKNRFGDILEEREPPNLRKILEKIWKACN